MARLTTERQTARREGFRPPELAGFGFVISGMRYPLENQGCIGSPQHPRVPASTVAKLLAEAGSPVASVAPETSAIDALRTLGRLRLDALLVLMGDRVVGVFSAHDFANAMAKGIDERQPVSAIVAAPDLSAAPDDTVDHCLARMAEAGLRYLPVVDGGKPVGILSLESLLRELADHHARVYEASELDHRIMFLRGTYSC